jgi:hypothetical protein
MGRLARADGIRLINCQDVAQEAWKGLKAKQVVVLPGLGNKFVVMASRFLPRSTPIAVAGGA